MAANNVSVLQTVTAASSSAAPASFTANYAATAVGSLLVACVAIAVNGSSPSVSTPAGWTQVVNAVGGNGANTLNGRLFAQPNNPGGVTAVLFNLTNVNGIAVILFEFTNMQNGAADPVTAGQGYSNGATTSQQAVTAQVANQLWIALLCSVTGQTLTNASTPAGWVASATATSTLGATNVQAIGEYLLPGPVFPNTPGGQVIGALTMGGSVACGVSFASFNTLNSGVLRGANDNGVTGAVGAGAGYAVGG